MKSAIKQTDNELKYAASDLRQAICAMPFGIGVQRYYQDLSAVEKEQQRRETIRIFRKINKEELVDALSKAKYYRSIGKSPRETRYYRLAIANRHNAYNIDRFRSSCFRLGWFRKYGC